MKKLTETNMLLLKAACLEMGIRGDIDEQGNVHKVEVTEEEAVEKTFLGIKIITRGKKTTRKSSQIMTLTEIMSKRIGADYDPNVIVRSIVGGLLEDKE